MTRHRHNGPDLRMKSTFDPRVMPVTGESIEERWSRSLPLADTAGQRYLESRGIPLALAEAAGVRFDRNWNGRPAVIACMRGANGELCSLHGRYLHQLSEQTKMLTIGPGGGILSVGDALINDPVILVEGLFDALSLSRCGFASLATVGRIAAWLPQSCAGKTVVLAFDGNQPGEVAAMFYQQFLKDSTIHRLCPPEHCKDWNSALLKRGKSTVEQWLLLNLARYANRNPIAS